MSEISFVVTKRALAYTERGRDAERQIAYRSASNDIKDRLASVDARSQVTVTVGGLLTLVVGDRGAVWRAHNRERAADFDALFDLLARYPDRPMRFICDLAPA